MHSQGLQGQAGCAAALLLLLLRPRRLVVSKRWRPRKSSTDLVRQLSSWRKHTSVSARSPPA